MNLDALKLFPDQRTGETNECVALTIADICGNADNRLYDADFVYAMTPRLMETVPNNGGRPARMTMLATIAYGLLPVSEQTFTAKTTSDLYAANWQNYSSQQIQDALQYTPKGIIDLYSYDDIVAYLQKYQRGVALTMNWYESFLQTNSSGILPAAAGTITSHEVAVYDADSQGLLIKPWLGPTFGDGGYVHLSRAQFATVFTEAHGFDPNGIRMVTLLYITALRLPYLMSYLPKLIAALTAPAPFQDHPQSSTMPPLPDNSPTVPAAPTPAPTASAPTYDWSTPEAARHSLRVICDEEGLTVEQKNLMSQVVHCESGYHTDTVHPNLDAAGHVASTDYGICQWNDYYHGKEISPDEALHDPEKAVRLMCSYVKQGLIKEWVCYSSGLYNKYAA